jgi:branched-chain amino acid transport system permease protein
LAVGAYGAYNFWRIPGMPPIPRWCSAVRHGVRHLLACQFARQGLVLAVATLAAQFFSDWMFLRIKWFTNDSQGRCPWLAGVRHAD